MDVLKVLEGAGGGLYLAVITVVGVRLLILARANRALPELLLGVAFLLGGTLGACLEVTAARMLAESSGAGGTLLLAGKLCGAVGINVYNVFIWRVFRPDDAWARNLVLVLVVGTAVALVGMTAGGAFRGLLIQPIWFWLEFTVRMASPIWLVAEAFRYWGQMRRRLALGLADPVVTDRFRLWAMGGACSVCTLSTSVVPRFVSADDPLMSFNILVLAGSGICSAICYWITFFPPQAYLARLRGRVASA